MLKGDGEWLGEESSLAPFVRAGLGILLAKGGWTWWHHPGAATTIMLDAVSSSGIVKWGGDRAVLSANEWLDVNTALAIADAFESLVSRRGGELRIMVQRQVHAWNAIVPIDQIRNDLASAFNRQRTFIEWPTDRRRPSLVNLPGSGYVVTGPDKFFDTVRGFLELIPGTRWVRAASSAHLTFGTISQLVTSQVTAEVVFVLERSAIDVTKSLDQIHRSTGAKCAILLPLPHSKVSEWLENLARALANGDSLEDALISANDNGKFKAEILASTQSYLLGFKSIFLKRITQPPPSPLDENPGSERIEVIPKEAKPGIEGARSSRKPIPNFEIDIVRMDSSPPVARVIDCSTTMDGDKINMFPEYGAIHFNISIIPFTPLHSPKNILPEDFLSWKLDSIELQVHLFGITLTPVSKSIHLPKSGSSTVAIFEYFIERNNNIDVRFIVSDGVRILQTARVKGTAGSKINFFIESACSPIGLEQKQFDLALLVNDSLGNQPSATALTNEGVKFTSLDVPEIEKTRDYMRSILESITVSPTSSLVFPLFQLANYGKTLLDTLKNNISEWPDKIERVQLTTPSDVYFPIEYLYEGEIPENEDYGLCNERFECLQKGSAKPNCKIRMNAEQLCPMGFLGITATIERQTWNKAMDKAYLLSHSKDISRRQQIRDLRRVAFAASNHADNFHSDELPIEFPHVSLEDIKTEIGTRQLTWSDWKSRVASVRPDLLILIPHIMNSTLFIGDDEKLAIGAIKTVHVGGGEPVVISIGCNSAIGETATVGLPAALMRQGAKIVICALTEVLGRYTNIATLKLAQQLMKFSSQNAPKSVGQVVGMLRREFLAKNNPLGLVLIAYGDADYILGAPEE